MTPQLYHRWLGYFKRNACHPLSLPMTIAVGTSLHASDKRFTAEDFVYPSIRENTAHNKNAQGLEAMRQFREMASGRP